MSAADQDGRIPKFESKECIPILDYISNNLLFLLTKQSVKALEIGTGYKIAYIEALKKL